MSTHRTRVLDVISQAGAGGTVPKESASLTENGFDSYSFLEMVVQLENSLDFAFSDEQLDYRKYKTLGDFIDLAERLVSQNAGAPTSPH